MTAEAVRISSDGCALAGTFTEAADPVAAALLPGSGRVDRDSDVRLPGGPMRRTRVTRAVADALTRARVSTLRCDKRGVGGSGGDCLRSGMGDGLADARAALAWLADRAAVRPLLVVGHSEGAWYAARLAADDQAAGAVLLSAAARPGADVLAWQAEQLATKLPLPVTLLLRVMRTDVHRLQRRNLERILASEDAELRLQGQRVNARWTRDFIAHDPAPDLARITVPLLAVTGGADLQVPPQDVDAIGRLARGPFEGHVVAGLSHLFRPDPRGQGPKGYRRAVRQPVNARVLDLIGG
ncbi:alpha/beta hydrolase family protein [Kitasatospora cathayae]|uniref:Alpha/beta fold hydrolase n=1 Tax=Kitasatospora cathayae TaxID=3004092 RepID=A0ABY7PVW6_9ACTN|nr:alpha/beta hydrolase [Kitasatospora sp. HUAS 3-15]WBP84582.1 alpha/beta fold hydrolase [Kitasatospora sp. HUAS 3-15]